MNDVKQDLREPLRATHEPLRVFIGYDAQEPEAFAVLTHSILTRASIPVSIVPLVRSSLLDIHRRPRGPFDSTDFAITRFLVPYLCDYRGTAVFMDCDMLCRTDLVEILTYPLAYPDLALYVCQHDYVPSTTSKFLDQRQTVYHRKNWSSLMVFNNARCTALTPDYVETAPGLALHQFEWLPDYAIGSLPIAFNWLVGEYRPNPDARLLHYTLGGPWFPETANCDHAAEWVAEREAMRAIQPARVGA